MTIDTADYFTIPVEMKARAQWMGYKLTPKVPPDPDGKQDKKPYDALTEQLADYTDRARWCAYADALAAVQSGTFDGLAYVFSADDPYTGVDLDHSRNKATGEIAAWAQDAIRRLDSYTEVSPSGTGVHVLVKATLPPGGRKRGDMEMYDERRFFTVTGRHVPGTPVTINERQAETEALHAEVFQTPGRSNPRTIPTPKVAPSRERVSTAGPSDAEVLQLAMSAKNGAKVAALYTGNAAGYPSQSEADYALIGALAFFTQDADQIERLMRGSGLYREKWDKRNGAYASTLRRNIEQLLNDDRAVGRDTYTPGRNRRHPVPETSAPETPGTHERNERNEGNGHQNGAFRSFSSFSSYQQSDKGEDVDAFPRLDDVAFYGTAGDVVRAIEPHTEASPVALLAQLLVCIGNAAGRHVYYVQEADRHYANLYLCLVGDTAKARKGTSWGHVNRVMAQADPTWAAKHVNGGLSSGEGIIHALRNVTAADLPIGDEGELLRDKRLLAREGEFASVLAQKARDGNILSGVLRDGWDGVPLGNLTKNAPEHATDTHLSVIGHITQAELVKHMAATDLLNGYANRFLFVATKRARLLPHGGDLVAVAEATAEPIRDLRTALTWAREPRQIAHDKEAYDLWEAEYEGLSTGHPGLFGAITSRAEAQVTRLSLAYALLDCSPSVTTKHLQAAIALWQYCADSARYIFGDLLGDTVADRILAALRATPEGMTRTEISALFDRNTSKARIDIALAELEKAGLAYQVIEPTTGEKGRPPERWKARNATKETKKSTSRPSAA